MKLLAGFCLFALLATLLLTASLSSHVQPTANAQRSSNDEIIARVTLKNEQELNRFVRLGLDLLEMRDGDDLFITTTQAQFDELRHAGWRIRIAEEQTYTLRNQSPETYSGGYRTVPEMRAFVDGIAARFPNLSQVVVYGSSWEKINSGGTAGHDLFAIKLTNQQTTGPKPTILITASLHARELVTSELALRLIEYLLNNYGYDGDATWLLDQHLIVIVPVANPDARRLAEQGLMQRKNMNTSYGGGCSVPPTSSNQYGVDLNRNFNFKWGTVNTPSEPRCGQTYPGPTAASEPESAAIMAMEAMLFADQRGPLDTDAAPLTTTGVYIDLHSYAGLVMWPWAHNSTVPPNGPDLQLIGTKLASYNGLSPVQAIALYPTSGSTRDYAYGVLGIAAFTFEVGLSSGPCSGFMPPFSCMDGGGGGAFWQQNLPAFIHAARLARAPYSDIRGPTTETLSTTRGVAGSTELRALLNEQFNGGQPIAAAEYYLDTPPWAGGSPNPMLPFDGGFNSVSEIATASIGSLTGRHLLYVRGRDASGNWGPVRAVFTPRSISPNMTDFDGDGRTDVAVFRPSDGTWYVSQSSDGAFRAQPWGISGDRITPADYDGDGKADIAVFRPSNGYWYILESQSSTLRATAWGVGEDLPAPGDYDADGKVDICVFRPSVGTWYALKSSDGSLVVTQFGASTDKPVQGDYDRDGKTDIAVYRPGQVAGASSAWYVLNSGDGSFRALAFGITGDRATPGDFDGDGKSDIAVFRSSTGSWYILQSADNIFRAQAWGTAGDTPAPGDYDGDGKTDVAVFRPSSGTWYALTSSNGSLMTQAWGSNNDVPAPSIYAP